MPLRLSLALLILLMSAAPAVFCAEPPESPDVPVDTPEPPVVEAAEPAAAPVEAKPELRRFVLPNGMKVMLVSDAKFNRSGITVGVGIGGLDDPADREGLAHFLEHMLLRGSEKYPGVDELNAFASRNGGYLNAMTSSDHTLYVMEVPHAVLPEALDRQAQSFIAPLFPPQATSREITSIHNECMRHLQNNFRRQRLVMSELYAADSPERKFQGGNRDTLAGTTAEHVRQFYESHYSADRMTLAVASKLSLDELEKQVRASFGPVPRRDLPALQRVSRYLPPKAALRTVFIEPARPANSLWLEFAVPSTFATYGSKPDRLVRELISHGGKGSLEEYLRAEGLATAVNAQFTDRTAAYGSLYITCALTPDGKKRHRDVVKAVFSYLRFLREAPFPADLHEQFARTAKLRIEHEDLPEGVRLTRKLAHHMLYFPLEVADRASDSAGAADEAAYRNLLAALTPDNLFVQLVAKGFPADRTERIYQTRYSYQEDTGQAYAALTDPPRLNFRLPGANPFMPTTTDVLGERPVSLIADPGLHLYYALDTAFDRPQTALIFRFVATKEQATREATALRQLYVTCLLDHLTPALNEATRAGLSASIASTPEGLRIVVAGYGDSGVKYLAHVAEQLRTFPMTPERFATCKGQTLSGLLAAGQMEAKDVALSRRSALAFDDFLPSELAENVSKATWKDVQLFARNFFAQGKIEAVIHGHLSADLAVEAARTFANKVGAKAAPTDALLRRRQLQIAPGEAIIDALAVAGVNSVYHADYVLPDRTPKSHAAALLFNNFLRSPYFAELRSNQQLGYIVRAAAERAGPQWNLNFVIQSSEHAPDELRRRSEAFLATQPAALEKLPSKEWNTLVAGVRAQLESKPRSIMERAALYVNRGYANGGNWDERQTILKALKELTPAEAAKVLSQTLAPETARRRMILLWSKQHKLREPITPTFTNRQTWKSTRRYE